MSTTKPAKDLVAGDRVMMADDSVKTVRDINPGFIRVSRADGGSEGSILINWKDGLWSQVGRSELCEMA